jgi:hypothetical protein
VVIPLTVGATMWWWHVCGDGFTVVEGTTLIADPIPIGFAGVEDDVPIDH